MDRRTRNLFVLAFVAVVVLAAASALLGEGGAAEPDASRDAPSMVGVIVGVEAEGLTDVRAFRLRTPDGGTTEFTVGELENGTEFPPGHLVEHQATAQEVRVWYRVVSGRNVAIRLEDAT